MSEIDVLSTNECPSLLEQLNITKPINEIESSDLLGKGLDSLEKWEVFYKTYSKWIGFSVHVDDVKRRDEVITMRRWVCSKEGFRRDEFVNKPDRKKRLKPIMRIDCQATLRMVLYNDTGMFTIKEFVPQHNHNTISAVEL